MRQKLIPLTHHIKFEKENSHVQDRTWCCFFHIAIVHKVSNVDSYNDTRNCKPLQSEHLQLKEWSIFGILTNASKSMHVPPFEWHIHFLWSHMCLAWVPEHILRIIGNVIRIRNVTRVRIRHGKVHIIGNAEQWKDQKVHLTGQWQYPPGCRRWCVESQCVKAHQRSHMNCALSDRHTCWMAMNCSERQQTRSKILFRMWFQYLGEWT